MQEVRNALRLSYHSLPTPSCWPTRGNLRLESGLQFCRRAIEALLCFRRQINLQRLLFLTNGTVFPSLCSLSASAWAFLSSSDVSSAKASSIESSRSRINLSSFSRLVAIINSLSKRDN